MLRHHLTAAALSVLALLVSAAGFAAFNDARLAVAMGINGWLLLTAIMNAMDAAGWPA